MPLTEDAGASGRKPNRVSRVRTVSLPWPFALLWTSRSPGPIWAPAGSPADPFSVEPDLGGLSLWVLRELLGPPLAWGLELLPCHVASSISGPKREGGAEWVSEQHS